MKVGFFIIQYELWRSNNSKFRTQYAEISHLENSDNKTRGHEPRTWWEEVLKIKANIIYQTYIMFEMSNNDIYITSDIPRRELLFCRYTSTKNKNN